MNQYPIYCINLEHRKDRKEHSLNQFTNLGISHNTVKYPHFTKDPRGGVYGCFDSHIKIWNDFFVNHPNAKYALVFEDDFVATHNEKSIIKDAVNFLDNNYDEIDIVFLHNYCVDVENTINNDQFICGYGSCAHAYFVTRHYITSIIDKHGKLPEPNGRPIDFDINNNIIDTDNTINSNKLFYTKDDCFKQLVDKSDNYMSVIDKLFRSDINIHMRDTYNIYRLLKNTKLLNDTQVKILMYSVDHIISLNFMKPNNV
jgi:GR25 family glycosyltransferase involved in LPS biosynthesis